MIIAVMRTSMIMQCGLDLGWYWYQLIFFKEIFCTVGLVSNNPHPWLQISLLGRTRFYFRFPTKSFSQSTPVWDEISVHTQKKNEYKNKILKYKILESARHYLQTRQIPRSRLEMAYWAYWVQCPQQTMFAHYAQHTTHCTLHVKYNALHSMLCTVHKKNDSSQTTHIWHLHSKSSHRIQVVHLRCILCHLWPWLHMLCLVWSELPLVFGESLQLCLMWSEGGR